MSNSAPASVPVEEQVEALIADMNERCQRIDALLTLITMDSDFQARRKRDTAFGAAWHDAVHALGGLPGCAYHIRCLADRLTRDDEPSTAAPREEPPRE